MKPGNPSPKSVLFLTTSSLATNPRLVKEVRSAIALGHRVTVMSFAFSNWSKGLNDLLLQELGKEVSLITLPGDRQNKALWLCSTILHQLAYLLFSLFRNNLYVLSVYASKRSTLLMWALKRKLPEFDLVIAHNPGAFVPSFTYAQKKGIMLGVDVEDYHPAETEDPVLMQRLQRMMRHVLAKANVITAASPLILEQCLTLVPETASCKAVINNVFSFRNQPVFTEMPEETLKLVWFSQSVGLDRGLQDVLKAMNKTETCPIQLTLVGHCTDNVKHQLQALMNGGCHKLVFFPPMKEQDLMELCSRHHIGLALETGRPLNRDICLTNKLFTYLLAGNAIIATQTAAQGRFFQENPGIGEIYPVGDHTALSKIVDKLSKDHKQLHAMRRRAYELARTTYNWEMESKLFASLYKLN